MTKSLKAELVEEMKQLNEKAIKETEEGFNLKIEELNKEDEDTLFDFYTNVNLTKKQWTV